jgi:hypothetical protein
MTKCARSNNATPMSSTTLRVRRVVFSAIEHAGNISAYRACLAPEPPCWVGGLLSGAVGGAGLSFHPSGEAGADEGDGPHPGGLLSGESRTGSYPGWAPAAAGLRARRCGAGASPGVSFGSPGTGAASPRNTTAITVSGFVSNSLLCSLPS